MHPSRAPLDRLADALGVARRYTDGLGRRVEVSPDTLMAVCTALGAPVGRVADAAAALERLERERSDRPAVPPVLVAWDGALAPVRTGGLCVRRARIVCEDGRRVPLDELAGTLRLEGPRLPIGRHTLEIETGGADGAVRAVVLAAPRLGWRPPRSRRRWGVAAQVAALRSRRSGAVGDLDDLETVLRAVAAHGGDVVAALPLLPTFNTPPTEPSPYSPVSRLFWSELLLGAPARTTPPALVDRLDTARADAEVRALLADAPDPVGPVDPELERYARFRGAQLRLGRDWRRWPAAARAGTLRPDEVDADEARFHRVAQGAVTSRLARLRATAADLDVALGLDLAVGVHPDGYDPWSRPRLFASGVSVGAPPDPGFPSGQDWGFGPLHPAASRSDGHRYLTRSIAHQAALAGLLRVDHIMAFRRLYWIPHGFPLDRGTYVRYPLDELLAVLLLESHRHRCEVVGENLGTVPAEIADALPRHGIRGMKLALFEAGAPQPAPPSRSEVAMIGTHDTPTLTGWIEGRDIDARVESGLLAADAAPAEREARAEAVARLAAAVGATPADPAGFLDRLLGWLARSESPLLITWIEELWQEPDQVNLPGTPASERPNWQRPLAGWIDDLLADPAVQARLARLRAARP